MERGSFRSDLTGRSLLSHRGDSQAPGHQTIEISRKFAGFAVESAVLVELNMGLPEIRRLVTVHKLLFIAGGERSHNRGFFANYG